MPVKEKMTLALLSEMQVYKPLCRLHRYAWFDNGSHVPCKYTIGFGLLFVFYLHNNKIQQINVIFNRLLRFAINFTILKPVRHGRHIVLKRIKVIFKSSVKYLKCNIAVSTVSVRTAIFLSL